MMAVNGSISLLLSWQLLDLVCLSLLLISAGVSCDPQCPRELSSARRHMKAAGEQQRGSAAPRVSLGWMTRSTSLGRNSLEVCDESMGQRDVREEWLWSS